MQNETLRIDGRYQNEIREIGFKTGYDNKDGFIIYSQGLTTVFAKLIRSTEKFKLKINLHSSDLSRNISYLKRNIYEMKHKLEKIFTPLIIDNNQFYQLNLEIKQDNGSIFSTLVNSISLLFCYCGVPIKDVCIGIELNENVDLCRYEENKTFNFCFVTLIHFDKVLYIESFGKMQNNQFKNSLKLGKECCLKIYKKIKEKLENIKIDHF